jgi:hypothetical protein
MNTRAWFTIDELNEWADNYHHNAVVKELRRVASSGEPAEIGEVYVGALENGLDTLRQLAVSLDLTFKWDKTTGRYIVEKPGRAYK